MNINDEETIIKENIKKIIKWIMDNIVPTLKECDGYIQYGFGGSYQYHTARYSTSKYHIGVSAQDQKWQGNHTSFSSKGTSHIGVGEMYGGCSDPLNDNIQTYIAKAIILNWSEIKTNLLELARKEKEKHDKIMNFEA